MFPATMSNSTSLSEEASVSSGTRFQDFSSLNPPQQQQKIKKKRNLPGNPDPDAEVIALSPKTLLTTNRFVCEICNKGFQRDQNLQLHRRGHNLPWKLRQRNSKEIIRKRVYVCPEPSCVHHNPSRALGDLTGIKKHFCRKHGEKKWKCEKCSKKYAVQSDWKAHSKTCGTREYRCDCGTLFSRKDSFITHRAFCDALAEESARLSTNPLTTTTNPSRDHPPLHYLHPQNPTLTTPPLFSTPFSSSTQQRHHQEQLTNHPPPTRISLTSWDPPHQMKYEFHHPNHHHHQIPSISVSLPFLQEPLQAPATHKPLMVTSPFQHLSMSPTPTHTTNNAAHMSATALLQKAVNVGAAAITGAAQAQSVGHMGTSTTTTNRLMKMDSFGGGGGHMGTAGISPEYVGFASGNLATWQKTDRLTRDFLGLTGDCGGGGGGGEGGGAGNDLLSFSGGVEYPPPYDRDHSLLKTPGFGFGEHSSEAWEDC
ncbi:protein indeterminate-domain 12-like [Macadamia integrifolia]|uniref:protein indeterminate-domain 12-like n=1 Tax=Macadamia integrifolia TaxID=60698 RepID=UPI001C4F7702|nr:protein indeterminate-domain 12-like [Macadamia integrifolia]